MKEGTKDGMKAAATGILGAGLGATIHATIGGIGIAATGTAVGVTLGPLMTIGAGVGLTGYGIYWLGKQIGKGQKKK